MRIKSICVYPVKSLQGCLPPSHTATPTGFNYDRRFMLQRVSDDKNMSIGKVYELCLFTTELVPATNPRSVMVRYTLGHTFGKPEESVDDKALEIPLNLDAGREQLVEREIDMHGSPTIGYDMPERYNEWFSKRLGYAVRLLYVGDNRRKVLGSVAPNAKALDEKSDATKNGGGWFGSVQSLIGSVTGYGGGEEDKENNETFKGVDEGVGFADVAPFLIVSTKSYENAARRLKEDKLDINKFRPNIIIEGADEEFEEDFWAELAIGEGDTRIVLTANCARCPSINVDFDTGKQGDKESGKILKLMQSDRRVDKGMKYSPIFGRYGFLAGKGPVQNYGEVELRVGDPVSVIRRNEERDRFQWPGISTDN